MKVDEWTSKDGHTLGGGEFPPCAGLPPTSPPKLKAWFLQRVHQLGCPLDMSIFQVRLKTKKRKLFLIGLPYVPLMEERKRHTIT